MTYTIDFFAPQNDLELLQDCCDYHLVVAEVSPHHLVVSDTAQRFAVLSIARDRGGIAWYVNDLGRVRFITLPDC